MLKNWLTTTWWIVQRNTLELMNARHQNTDLVHHGHTTLLAEQTKNVVLKRMHRLKPQLFPLNNHGPDTPKRSVETAQNAQ
eukprot:5301281-Amphidinium_carterae.1